MKTIVNVEREKCVSSKESDIEIISTLKHFLYFIIILKRAFIMILKIPSAKPKVNKIKQKMV
jgi:hypothetical protein